MRLVANRKLGNAIADASQDFKSLLKSAGAESLLQEQGALLVFESANSLMQAQRDENVLREYGIQFESLNGAQAASRLGRGAPSVAGGRFYPEMKSVVDPYAVVNALVQQFITSGGKLHRRHVKSFDFHPEYVRIITDDGDVNVSKAVLAAGTGSPALMKTLGLSVPMAAERGYHVMLDGGPTLHMPWTFHERGFVATPMTGGTRLAGTVELGGGEPDWRRAMLLARHMQQLFPDTIMSVTQQWTGNRPTTPDYLPVMGPLRKNPRILTAFGHQHLGLTLSATTARLIRLLINKQPLPYSIEPFRPERFTI